MASLKYKDGFLKALEQEIQTQQPYLAGQKINTIYFGGGTPSILSTDELHQIIDLIFQYHDVAPKAEITLELTPTIWQKK